VGRSFSGCVAASVNFLLWLEGMKGVLMTTATLLVRCYRRGYVLAAEFSFVAIEFTSHFSFRSS
jgi:hypothetical protein